jgi:hypothetical protein
MLLLHIPFEYETMLRATHEPIFNAVDNELLNSIPRVLRGAFWNAALIGGRGLLSNEWELRKEFTTDVVDDFRIAVHRRGLRI